MLGSRHGHAHRSDVRYHPSWLEGSAEFDGAHRDGGGAEGLSLAELSDPGAFRRFVAGLIEAACPETPRKPGYVTCTYLWIVDGETFLGSLGIRHELNDFLFNEGGHIGYSVRPSARRQGHAAKALADALPIARELGIERVLLTCDEANAGSRPRSKRTAAPTRTAAMASGAIGSIRPDAGPVGRQPL